MRPSRSVVDWLFHDVFSLRRIDLPVLWLLGPLFGVVTAASVIIATFTKTAFLVEYDVGALPIMFLASSVFTAVISMAYVGAVERVSLAPRFVGLVGVAIVSFGLLHALYPLQPKAVALAQLVWGTGVSQLMLVQSWNMSSSLLPSRQGKRLFPVFAALSTLGAAVGGGLVSLGLKVVEARLLSWLVLLLLVYPLLRVKPIVRQLQWNLDAHSGDEVTQTIEPAAGAANGGHRQVASEILRGFKGIASSPLLLRLASLVFLLQTASLIIDFQFSTELKLHYSRNEMAGFLGTYYAIANTVAFFVALMATSRIVRVVGIGVAISASAIFVGAGSAWYFGAARLGLGSPFWAIVATSFLERIFQFALTRNAMQMLVAPLDSKKGERAKTLIDGVVYRVATAGTSLLLLFFRPTSEKLALLAPVTIIACIGVVLVGLSMNPWYRKALFEGLRARRVDSDVDAQTRALLLRSAMGEVRERLASTDVRDIRAALDIIRDSKLPVEVADLLPATQHADPDVARRALELMNEVGLLPSEGALLDLLQRDRPPAVLREVLRLLQNYPNSKHISRVTDMLEHPDLGVARLATMWLHKTGGSALAGQLQDQLRADMQSPVPEQRARAAYISGVYLQEPQEGLVQLLHDPSPEVRLNAVISMGQIGAPEFVDPLIDCLGRGDLVTAAQAALVRYGPALVAHVRARVQQRPPGLAIQLRLLRVVEHFGNEAAVKFLMEQAESQASVVRNNAVQSLWRLARDPEAPRPPSAWLRARVLSEIEALQLLQRVDVRTRGDSPQRKFFAAELAALRLQSEMRGFRLLGLLGARAPLHRAYLHYRSEQQRVRSNAIELLDQHLGDEELKPFVALVERIEPAATSDDGDLSDSNVVINLLSGADPWLGRVWAWTQAPQGGRMTRDPMDLVFLLKGVPLLSDLSGEQLLPVAEIVQHVHVEGGDLVFAEGQPGNHLYVILEGNIEIMKGQEHLATLGTKECFGEMALLDQAPRMASARAQTDADLLAISRDDFQDLLDMHPALARGIIRVLTQRLRGAQD
ncbi:MAG: cyclic nucleotide-binding domain-containing protein [Deltaproteobacteria bacterium]|nr:cyclic nucleotide-binding domain-containing protein [Deltaproteobacteria bacterium]